VIHRERQSTIDIMKLATSVLLSIAQANKFDPKKLKDNTVWFRTSEWTTDAEPITFDCNGIYDLYDTISDLKWYRQALYMEPTKSYEKITEEEKFFQLTKNDAGVIEQMDLGLDLANYQLIDGELEITPTGGFDQPAAGLLLNFLCEADLQSPDDSKLDEHDDALYSMRFIDVPENPIDNIEDFEYREFPSGSSETLATCISGYSSRPLKINWYAVNQAGERRTIPDSESFIDSTKLEDTFAHSTNVELPLQFPYSGGSLIMDGSFDKNYFECEVEYKDAVNKEEVSKTATARFPENDVIRVEHDMTAIDFSVNDKLIAGTSEIFVPLDEPVNVNCQPNGFKIGEEHVVKTTLGDGTIVSDQVTFGQETDLVCEASLNGKNLEKKVTVKPRAIGEVDASMAQARKKDPYTIMVTLSDDGNVDFEDEEVEVVIVDKKGRPVEVTETDRTANKIFFTTNDLDGLGDPKAHTARISIKNSEIVKEEVIENKLDMSQRSSEKNFCRFSPFLDKGSSPIKMWYQNCDDEGSLTSFTDFEKSTDIAENKVLGKLKEDAESGVYVCCYDTSNDVQSPLQSAFSQPEYCSEKEVTFQQDSPLAKCTVHFIPQKSGFPWWIILVLLLIILVVIGACYFWNKKKQENENDLEAGNVNEIKEKDGEIEAAQEEESQELLAQQQQQQSQETK